MISSQEKRELLLEEESKKPNFIAHFFFNDNRAWNLEVKMFRTEKPGELSIGWKECSRLEEVSEINRHRVCQSRSAARSFVRSCVLPTDDFEREMFLEAVGDWRKIEHVAHVLERIDNFFKTEIGNVQG